MCLQGDMSLLQISTLVVRGLASLQCSQARQRFNNIGVDGSGILFVLAVELRLFALLKNRQRVCWVVHTTALRKMPIGEISLSMLSFITSIPSKWKIKRYIFLFFFVLPHSLPCFFISSFFLYLRGKTECVSEMHMCRCM